MKKTDLWNPLALLAGGTVFGVALAWSAIPALSKLSGDWLGFYGSVTGGLVGGLLGVGAGVLAWTAAQQQIEAQTRMLDLATAEHRSRLRKILNNVRATLVATEADFTTISRSEPEQLNWDTLRRSFTEEHLEFKRLAIDPDIWRISDELHSRITLINRGIHLFNSAFGDSTPPPMGTEERETFNRHAAYIIRRCRECIRLIDIEGAI
ncbi:hypothetical protein [Xanthobacter agilis]|jgi:hypothetical protein|uniref:Uncharacterized protein n=1 Tax=Xanthobacter agilis TaxID=47492 RepID=A0ABU0LBT7_XANAG|nr:hypothetical protein [Xanthobacter agilis]MDQ0504525.1 hypothetical protein [Xanthobacter agilis]